MPTTVQKQRALAITTPLGKDFVVIESLAGTEGISQLFSYDIELLREETTSGTVPTPINPKDLLGQPVSVEMFEPGEEGVMTSVRHFSGIVNSITAGVRDERFSYYEITVVPQLWMLTQVRRSRIFQQLSVPEVLKAVFKGLNVKYELQGTFDPRNYCVQYRETDFDFASRLMEEEGIFYFFLHSAKDHTMVVANTPQSHPVCPKAVIPFFLKVEGEGFEPSIQSFDTDHILQTGKVTFWDHNFQLNTQKLKGDKPTMSPVAENERRLEFYDYPGGYARKYDGINPGGGDRSSDLEKILPDGEKTASIAMQALDVRYRTVYGAGTCGAMVAGHKFTLKDHADPDVNGPYFVDTITHTIRQSPGYISEEEAELPYRNEFTCIPLSPLRGALAAALYRPLVKTPKPYVHGSQTAIVVGPAGEEIAVDKYGRVKVQFHWDREGEYDLDSSCWVRVAQMWAGNKWGTMFIPRIGMEVIVNFLEGDPDQPIIVGCVYNPANMPPYELPDEKTKSTLKSYSSPGGGGFNELRFEDKKGKEEIFIHAQHDETIEVEHDCVETIKNDRHLLVSNHQLEEVGGDKHVKVKGDHAEEIDANMSLTVGSTLNEKISQNYGLDAGMAVHIKAGMTAVIEAGVQLTLKVGGNYISVTPAGVAIQGTMVLINSGGAAGTGAGCNPDKPKKPTAATTAKKGAAAAKPKNPPKPPNAGLKNLVAQMAALSAAQVAQNAVNEAIARAVINKAAAELVDDPLNSIAAAARAAVKVPGKIKKASDEAKVEAAKEVAVQTAKMVLAAVDGVPFI